MTFVITYMTNNSVGYGVIVVSGNTLDSALYEYGGSEEDIISIVRVF